MKEEDSIKRSRFSDEQIIAVLKEHEAGAKVDDICRRQGVSGATFYAWLKKFGGMEPSDAKRLQELEAENAKLKPIVADQVLDMSAMKEAMRRMAAIVTVKPGRTPYGVAICRIMTVRLRQR